MRALALFVALLTLAGCNLIFGLDEPALAGAGGATGSGAASAGGSGAGIGDGGSDAGGGGGDSEVCPTTCPNDCFEGVCNGDEPVELAPGGQVSCVRVKSGSVWCFGTNRYGGLGIPVDAAPDQCATTIGGIPAPCSFAALRVELPGKAQSVAVGHHAACAVLENDEVWCWGRNDRGLLGHVPDPSVDDECSDIACRTSPSKLEGLPPASTVVMGDTHACAMTSDGLWCWGLNHAGQLGNGETVPSDVGQVILPAQVTPPGKVEAAFANDSIFKVVLSRDHTCAVDGAKTLWCWGSNSHGQAGLIKGAPCGLCAEPLPIPTKDLTLSNAIAVAAP
ncbi:MAG: hypothetical protein JNK04_05605, partial [Myxococcales bacterium]|nr:hypothetical protein [Myxococcales bacterium]